MALPTGRMPTRGWQKNSDDTEQRTRVATYIDGTSKSYENTEFLVSSSPTVIDFYTDTGGQQGGKSCHKGWLIVDGPGDIQVEISADGSNYGGVHTIKGGERISLDDLSIQRLRLTFVSESAYRVAMF